MKGRRSPRPQRPTVTPLEGRLSPAYLVAGLTPAMPVWYEPPLPPAEVAPGDPGFDPPMNEDGNGFPPTDPYPAPEVGPLVPA